MLRPHREQRLGLGSLVCVLKSGVSQNKRIVTSLSASLEERQLDWLASSSMNHAPVSSKEIFRACSLLL